MFDMDVAGILECLCFLGHMLFNCCGLNLMCFTCLIIREVILQRMVREVSTLVVGKSKEFPWPGLCTLILTCTSLMTL